MLLLFVTPHLSTGGLPQYLYVKIKKLINSYDIYVVEWEDIAPIYRVQKDKIRDIITNSHLFTWSQGIPQKRKEKDLIDILHSVSPDVIHFEEFPEWFLPTNLTKEIYSKKNRTYKIIETSHNSDFNPENKRFLPDAFVFVSEIQEDRFRHFKVPSTIVEYPIEDYKRPYRETALRDIGLDPSYKHILNVGLFTPGKNQGEAFEMARSLQNNKILFHFVGNQAENFREYWEPLMKNKPKNCIIHGERNDIDKFYSACDLLLFTSKSELNPLVPREALSWHMPVLMYNLSIYQDSYNRYDNVEFLGKNIDINIHKVLAKLNISKLSSYRRKLPKVRMVHLLTQPDDTREVESVKSLSPLKELGIEYIQHVNEPCKIYPNISPITHHVQKKPGYYGAYLAFREAIEKEFTKDIDFFMICECDCILTVKPEHFIDALVQVCKSVDDNDIYYFSFGSTGEEDIVWSNKVENIDESSFITNKIILAHCILFPQKAREFLLRSCREIGWDTPDIWLNEMFMGRKRMAILNKPLAEQHEGESLIDCEYKGTIQTFDIPDKNMENLLKNVYENTIIGCGDILKVQNRYNFNFIKGAFLEVLGEKEESDNEYYKSIDGWFNFEDIYRYAVREFSDGSNFVEIGSWFGKSTCFMATEIKNSGKNIKFDVIDNWKGSSSEEEQQEIVKCRDVYKEFLNNMKSAGVLEYINDVKMDSSEAAELYDDNSIDFLFIDGGHRYEDTISNIRAWYSKVRDGGIIGGHDYMVRDGFGVIEAVNEYFGNDKTVHTTSWLHRRNSNEPIVISDEKYLLEAIDTKENNVVYSDKLDINYFIKCNRQWYTDWLLRVSRDGNVLFQHRFNLEGKRVYIEFDSKSIGDTIAWIPYVEEFRRKHNSIVYCSTFWNRLWKESYPDINFVGPGTTVDNIYAMYVIGYTQPYDSSKNPSNPITIPLQRVASDILGLEYEEKRPLITTYSRKPKVDGKYVCFSIHSTAQCKYWNCQDGWQKVVDHILSVGYKVVNVSKEKVFMGNIPPKNVIDHTGDKYSIEHRINELRHADLFVGVSSGIAWLAWTLNIPTVIVSGTTRPFNEPQNGIYRVYNNSVCNGCMNDPNFVFDKGDWYWCPRGREFECSVSITPEMVIDNINVALNIEEQRAWDRDDMWKDDGHEWSRGFGNTDSMWNDIIYPRVKEFARRNILEIAPGHGRLTHYLALLSDRLDVVDMNKSCIDICKEKLKDYDNIEYHVNDGKSLPIKSDSIDFVVSWDSFVHFHESVVRKYIREINRVLVSNGHGFIHHSSLRGGKSLSFNNKGGRSNMNAEIFENICENEGLIVLNQEHRRMNDEIVDCFTTFKKRGKLPRIVVLVAFYNCEDYIRRCLESVKGQKYDNFVCYAVDDVSTDRTQDIAKEVINGDERFIIISNEQKMYQLGNYYNVLHNDSRIHDQHIVTTLDGDDYFPDKYVLGRVYKAYADCKTWITYGSFVQLQNGKLEDGWAKRKYDFSNLRNEEWSTTHLRTFKTFLFRNIKRADLIDPESNWFFRSSGDVVMMFPMLEMAGEKRTKFLSSVNYVYNDDNPLNRYKLDRPEQIRIDKYIRSKSPYEKC